MKSKEIIQIFVQGHMLGAWKFQKDSANKTIFLCQRVNRESLLGHRRKDQANLIVDNPCLLMGVHRSLRFW